MGTLIAGRGLCMRYPHAETSVIDELDFTIDSGEFVAIVGRSGSGKSTLLHLLGAMDQPTAGSLIVAGIELAGLNEKAQAAFRRRALGFVFQAYNLVPTLNVAENLRLPLELNAISERGEVAEVIEALGLHDRAAHYPEQLSGGEQQRVAIGRALIHQPQLILADEPTGNLDAQTSDQVLALLLRAVRAQGCTLILATHSLDVARSADRVLRLENGHLVPVG